MVGGILIGALGISLLVSGATVTLAQNSAMSPSEPAANAGVAKRVLFPSPELLEHQSKPNCEIPPSDRLLGAIPETTQLIYERECYKNAETVVRTKLQLLQDAIGSTIKAPNDAAASRTLQPAEGGEQGAPAPAKDAAIAPQRATHRQTRESSPPISIEGRPRAQGCRSTSPRGRATYRNHLHLLLLFPSGRIMRRHPARRQPISRHRASLSGPP
jgi:hypothetical protein